MNEIDLRLGDWRDVLADVQCDALISDPPYSERTHIAQRGDAVAASKSFKQLGYSSYSDDDVRRFVDFFRAKVRGWWVIFSDHELQRSWEKYLSDAGLYVFAPLPQVTLNRSVRLAGDGPAVWTTWITVARPRTKEFAGWGALPGAYVDHVGMRKPGIVQGAKQRHLMDAIVRDYTKKGDLVCDPCAGGGTTALAAAGLGRRFVGSEIDADTHAKANARVAGGVQYDLFV